MSEDWEPCPDCTPENVEKPCLACRALGVGVFGPDYFCPTCSTPPENVETSNE